MGVSTPCPELQRLRAFAFGQLSPAEATGLQAHVPGCPVCHNAITALRSEVAGAARRPGAEASAGRALTGNGGEGGGAPSPEETAGGARDHDQRVAVAGRHDFGGAATPAPAVAPAPPAGREAGGAGDGDCSTEARSPGEPSERPAGEVGPYKLLQRIGEGGMGTVYLAEQTRPVRRRVALKLIRPGMDSPQFSARFEAERQALALMDHPNIAKVLDAGTAEGGRPFFAMELVKGVPITKYCDDLRLGVRDRLELFVPLCRALQHAHQKGVIHRDLKPSNVLVAVQDGRPVPKVIDFGVAKAIDHRLTDRTVHTEFGALVGTPAYMSPEQADLGALDVDTRSDVYALGVLLYELLTGSTPLDAPRRKDGLAQLLRAIREEEPTRPSARLAGSPQTLAAAAATRRTDGRRLTAELRGDLDWIAMKCLEKDRTRRYDTANGLARDIERHLAGDAVEASPPSAVYYLAKLARRHRKVLVTAMIGAALLVAGTAVSIWQAVRATRNMRVAVEAHLTHTGMQLRAADAIDQAQAERRFAEADAAHAWAVNAILARGGFEQAEALLLQRYAELSAGQPDAPAVLEVGGRVGAGVNALKERKALPPAVQQQRLAAARERLARFYEARGQKEKAAAWRAARPPAEQPAPPPARLPLAR